ncbi:response regulator transcription factor [Bordetella genomosp. 13]|uniref:response regulator transcription factor n=1 Tax=Bordetella genomosp. 13 TaxID=463040 RepID=UPI0011A17E6F|nr:response regulator transcription factor [Bordetella genomosp. 13]
MSKMVLIEAHPLLRLGLQHILSKVEGAWEIIGLDLADLGQAAEQTAGAELLIFGLPIDTDAGWQALSDVRQVLSPTRILLLVDAIPTQALARLPEGSVRGCLMKRASIEVLEAAIRLVMAGGQCFPSGQTAPSHAGEIRFNPAADMREEIVYPAVGFHPISEPPLSAMASGAQLLNITPRQYEVLVLLSRGYPIKTVSRMLNISVATAKTHACTLYQRLQVKNKGEAVYTALQRGATLNWDPLHANGSEYETTRA